MPSPLCAVTPATGRLSRGLLDPRTDHRTAIVTSGYPDAPPSRDTPRAANTSPLPPRSSQTDAALPYTQIQSSNNSFLHGCNAAAGTPAGPKYATQTPASAETSEYISPPADAAPSAAGTPAQNAD